MGVPGKEVLLTDFDVVLRVVNRKSTSKLELLGYPLRRYLLLPSVQFVLRNKAMYVRKMNW